MCIRDRDHDNYVGAAATGETVDTPEASLINRDGLMVSAMLVDIAPEGETFPAFNTAPTYVEKTILAKDGAWMGGGLENLDPVSYTHLDVYKRQDGHQGRRPGESLQLGF